jgi:Protein of unknown function (DUF5818)
MRKATSLFATLALAATLTPFTLAQQQPDQSPSSSPAATQQPQDQSPTSQPSSDPGMQPQSQQPTSDQQQPSSPDTSSPSTATAPDSSQTGSASSQASFSGQIVKAGGKYVLKANGMNYQLDDQDKAKQFNGQTVKVSGDLDKSTSTIHVTDISPAS